MQKDEKIDSGRSLQVYLDTSTAILLDEICNRYKDETETTILARAIRDLYDRTCRQPIRRLTQKKFKKKNIR